jgi:uncharacterized protein (DUF2252 family)
VDAVTPQRVTLREATGVARSSVAGPLDQVSLSGATDELERRWLREPSEAVRFVQRYNDGLPLNAEDRAEKDELMRESAMMFLKANPALFYEDVRGPYAAKTQLLSRPCPTGTLVADAHILNFGTLRSPEGKMVWGLNDFDQSGQGRLELDLCRLAASAAVLGEELGLDKSDRNRILEHLGKAYFDALRAPDRGSWLQKHQTYGSVRAEVDYASKGSREAFLDEHMEGHSLKPGPRQRPVSAEVAATVRGLLQSYEAGLGDTPSVKRPLEVWSVAERLGSGGSSFGLPRYYAAVAGADGQPVVLEIKQILPAPLDSSDPDLSKADAAAVVANQRSLGGLANPLTGSTGGWLVREREWEKSNLWPDKWGYRELKEAVQQAALVLARAHTQTPGASRAVAAWVGDDSAVAIRNLREFARDYASQTRVDHRAFVQADPSLLRLAASPGGP